MAWEVEFSDEFGAWWDELSAAEQKSVDFTVSLLQELGPMLRMPHSSGVETSRHAHMCDLPLADAIYGRHLREIERGG